MMTNPASFPWQPPKPAKNPPNTLPPRALGLSMSGLFVVKAPRASALLTTPPKMGQPWPSMITRPRQEHFISNPERLKNPSKLKSLIMKNMKKKNNLPCG
eukprot:Lithocolla_globosa_v1_NODE_1276_length_2703_cov_31.340883.p4 type:complete len:100 gc:universal NODE_1276_length_2703_cov_31.340883:1504-1803(+)